MGWYLMYLSYPKSGDIRQYKFRILMGSRLAGMCDQETYVKAVKLGRCVWLNIQKEGLDPDDVSEPEVVWRSQLEVGSDDPASTAPVDSGIHQPDPTAEYEFHECAGQQYQLDI